MARRTRIGLYLEGDDVKKAVKVAAAKRGVSLTKYCSQAIIDRLRREGELSDDERDRRLALFARMETLRNSLGRIGVGTADLVKEGRRR